jgi:hypothetical protein
LNIDIKHIGERSMTRTSDTFGALALTVLTVFALWTSTLAMPSVASPAPAATILSVTARA